MLVVTGSTGHVGRLVAEELAAPGHDQRLIVRDPTRAPKFAGAEVVVAGVVAHLADRMPLHPE